MNKKILMITITLLAVAMFTVPVNASTTEAYSHTSTPNALMTFEKAWSEGSVWHGRGGYREYTYEGTLGEGTLECFDWVINFNFHIGHGVASGKVKITITSGTYAGGTIEGTYNGEMGPDWRGPYNVVYTHGTGPLEGIKIWGTNDGSGYTVVGSIMYP